MQSEQIGNLAKALAAAVAEMETVKKGRTATIEGKDGRRGYSYKYADLSDVIESYRGPLAKHGLAISQPITWQDSTMVLRTVLLHESGEWIESTYPVPTYQRPQDTGSALTYARRYAVSAILGITAEEDDDGKRAQEGEQAETPKRAKKQDAAPESAKPALPPGQGLTDTDIVEVGNLAKRAGLAKHGDLKPFLQAIGGVDTLRALERRYLPDLRMALEKKGDELAAREVADIFGGERASA